MYAKKKRMLDPTLHAMYIDTIECHMSFPARQINTVKRLLKAIQAHKKVIPIF